MERKMTPEVYKTISYIENIPRMWLKFLADLDFEKKLAAQHEETQVSILMDKGRVRICAPKDTVHKVSAAVWEAAANIRDLKLEMSQNAVEILRSRACQAFLEDQFTANNLQAALAFDSENEQNVFVMGMKTKVAEEASELVKRLIVEECLELGEDQVQLDKSEKWHKLRFELTEKCILSLSFDRSNKQIRLVGTKEDVSFALKAIERFLNDNAIVSSVVEFLRHDVQKEIEKVCNRLQGRLKKVTKTFEEMEQELRNVQEQLHEKELKEANLQEQLREKNRQEQNSRRQFTLLEQQATRTKERLQETSHALENAALILTEREQQLTHLQGQLQEKELQEANLREQLREKDRREQNSQMQLREMAQQVANLQEQSRDKEQETASLSIRVTTLEGQLREKDREVNELENTLSTAQQVLSSRQRQQSLDWTISRDQIQLTDKILGKGGWGSVVEGTYCGCAVAVKQIHELILSSHNRGLFVREMDIASRCRHPCLLQFIGATNDEGSPLFVTELMELSLRALLEQRTLSEEVSIISLDVARALNYLHQKKPSPIIHRDISSANVLLWRQGDQWRGKLSDYGAANFMQQTMTVAPGATIYIAPEALTSNQSVKVDVYSFGVLLCEMCIGELPDPDKRDQQVAMVKSRLHRSLIRECLQLEPRTRPDMEEIIKRLEEPL